MQLARVLLVYEIECIFALILLWVEEALGNMISDADQNSRFFKRKAGYYSRDLDTKILDNTANCLCNTKGN